jgi:hypothetical protein
MPNNIDKYLDFSKQHGWKESSNSVFRVNTAEGYEALNLKSNGKNKHIIILSIGEDKVTKDAANALFEKHPDTSIIATLDEPLGIILSRLITSTVSKSRL